MRKIFPMDEDFFSLWVRGVESHLNDLRVFPQKCRGFAGLVEEVLNFFNGDVEIFQWGC